MNIQQSIEGADSVLDLANGDGPPGLVKLRSMPVVNQIRPGHPLRNYLEERGVGIGRAAELLSISERSLRDILDWKSLSTKRANFIAQYLQVDVDQLFPQLSKSISRKDHRHNHERHMKKNFANIPSNLFDSHENVMSAISIGDVQCEGTPITAYRIRLDAVVATGFLATMRGNRPVRAQRVRRYIEIIKAGKWPYTGEPIIFDVNGVMNNGQHRCIAVQNCETSIEVAVIVGVPAEAFKYMDQPATRTSGDFLSESVASANTVAGALGWLWREERNFEIRGGIKDMPAFEANEMKERYPSVAHSVISTRARGIGQPSVLTYANYRMRRLDPEKAETFFAGLLDGTGLVMGDPRLVLRNRLIKNKSEKAKLPTAEILALIIKAWRLHLESRKVGALRWRTVGDTAEAFPTWPGPALIPE